MNISTSVFSEPLFRFNLSHYHRTSREASIHRLKPKLHSLSSSNLTLFSNNYDSSSWIPPHKFRTPKFEAFAANTDTLESLQSSDVIFNQTFPINRVELVSPFPFPLLLLLHPPPLLLFGTLFGCRESSGNSQMKSLYFFSGISEKGWRVSLKYKRGKSLDQLDCFCCYCYYSLFWAITFSFDFSEQSNGIVIL